MKVKTITATKDDKLTSNINNFIRNKKVTDIKLTSSVGTRHVFLIALIMYEEENND